MSQDLTPYAVKFRRVVLENRGTEKEPEWGVFSRKDLRLVRMRAKSDEDLLKQIEWEIAARNGEANRYPVHDRQYLVEVVSVRELVWVRGKTFRPVRVVPLPVLSGKP